jgi:hypothetical protein
LICGASGAGKNSFICVGRVVEKFRRGAVVQVACKTTRVGFVPAEEVEMPLRLLRA